MTRVCRTVMFRCLSLALLSGWKGNLCLFKVSLSNERLTQWSAMGDFWEVYCESLFGCLVMFQSENLMKKCLD